MAHELYTNLILHGLLGVLIGCYGTLVGAGGGFLMVPLFLLLYKMPHDVAVGTSLAVVAANGFSGSFGYVFRKTIDYRAGVSFALATIPGAIGGALLTDYVSGPLFYKIFGALLIVVSLYLFFRKPLHDRPPARGRGWGRVHRKITTTTGTEEYSYSEPVGLSLSVVAGALSSWLGIGGGLIHVPLMTEVLRFPVHIAVATSHFILAWTALFGAVTHGMEGHIDAPIAISTGIGAILGAQLGVRLSPRMKGSALIRYLSLAMLAVGVRLLIG